MYLDTINGVGWKFITLGIGQIFRDGGAVSTKFSCWTDICL